MLPGVPLKRLVMLSGDFMRHFEVQSTIVEEGKKWRTNICSHVVADSVIRAIELVMEKHKEKDVVVWGVQHRGNIDIIQD